MEEQKAKQPVVVAGAFIFNDKDELFLMKSSQWKDKYICPGGKIELGEKIEETLKREVREETAMEIKDVEVLGVTETLKASVASNKNYKHLIFINAKASLKKAKKIKLNEEAEEYKWLSVSEWRARKDVSEFSLEAIEKFFGERDEYEILYKRALADYQNLLRQSAKEKEEFIKYAAERAVEDLVPVFDNLKLAIQYADKASEENPWFAGVVHVTKQFEDVLSSLGLGEIKAEGQNFDHKTMEAVDKEETDDKKKDGVVARVVKPGYKLKDKILNHAKVVVYEYKNN